MARASGALPSGRRREHLIRAPARKQAQDVRSVLGLQVHEYEQYAEIIRALLKRRDMMQMNKELVEEELNRYTTEKVPAARRCAYCAPARRCIY